MRALLAGAVCLAAAVAVVPTPAPAASGCTAWMNYQGATEQCIGFVLERTRGAGLKSSLSGDTLYFWFGDNVVMVRCAGSKGIIMLASYHQQNNQACSLQDRVQNTLK